MISIELARALRTAGLRWHPVSGDRFLIESSAAEPGDGADVFTVSEMTVDVHHFPTGSQIGFNGTTEWALDSVDLTDTLWLPREDQLRALLRDGFVSLAVVRDEAEPDVYEVRASILGVDRVFAAATAEDAYGEALLDLIVQSLVGEPESVLPPRVEG
ncbi:pilus assembly protein CpaE [Cnuibacter sp. UC19_7]|uniref:pilus assembly protein CpaE n=1 Tax=Cnuibacter sp. UC19_7 TaxID=3350166 RepID=UPI00366D7EB2